MTKQSDLSKFAWLKIAVPSVAVTCLVTLAIANLGDQQKDIDYRINNLSDVSSKQFQLTLENMMGPTFTRGNRIQALQNGDEIFPSMLEAIRNAKKTINFESYIYVGGKIGDAFIDALSERARAGVKVKMLIDWVGSQKIDDERIARITEAGVDVKKFHPPGWFSMTRMNNRTHRKILVVDGVVGFTGGVGISDEWLGKASDPEHWRDSHYRVVGPAVGQLQAAFTDNWLATSPQVLLGAEYFPLIEENGPSTAQVFKSSPREGAASALLMYMMSIAASKKELLIANAYFIPSKITLHALLDARKRGVRIAVIVPGPFVDSKVTQMASRSTWGELLEAGVEIYEYQPTMFHCKYMIVDQQWMSVGSTNFDDRSFRLNSEENLNILDKDFAEIQARVFAEDLKNSKRVSLDQWRARPILEKTEDFVVSLFSSQL
jgi:cardiolipin synthase